MTTDIHTQVLFSDGEGLTPDDLNNAQRFLASSLFDQLLASLIPNVGLVLAAGSHDPEFGAQGATEGDGFDWAAVATSRAFCLQPGQAFLRPGSAFNKVQIAPGTLLQLTTATLTGSDAKFLAYAFTGAEEWTIANGDATNPRVDLLQMKLEYLEGGSEARHFQDETTRAITSTTPDKTRRVQCTLSTKAGTAGANPTIPDPDAGYCVVGTVYVEALYAASEDPIFGLADPDSTDGLFLAYVQDQRFPLGVKAYRVEPCHFYPKTAWTVTNNLKAAATNATNELIVPCPKVLGRVIGVAVEQNDAQDLGTQYLSRSNNAGGQHGALSGQVGITQVAFPAGGGIPSVDWRTFEATPDFADNKEPVQSAVAKIGWPMWTNGCRTPTQEYKNIAQASRKARRTTLMITNAPNTTEILGVVFFIAEGI